MTVALYNTAVDYLKKSGEIRNFRAPASDETIRELEIALGVNLPLSYKAMLRDFGILMFSGQTIFGIGRLGIHTQGGSGVLFQTKAARDRGQITSTMVRILSSGYGPEFCIDCSEMNSEQEAPIYLVPADGSPELTEKVSSSFGEFLLAEAQELA